MEDGRFDVFEEGDLNGNGYFAKDIEKNESIAWLNGAQTMLNLLCDHLESEDVVSCGLPNAPSLAAIFCDVRDEVAQQARSYGEMEMREFAISIIDDEACGKSGSGAVS